MKTSPFKVGDKVMRKDGGTTIDCVAAVRYRYLHEGRPGSYVSHLELVGQDNPNDKNGGWPSEEFRLIWSDDRAAR
jgi:hypothetical protein